MSETIHVHECPKCGVELGVSKPRADPKYTLQCDDCEAIMNKTRTETNDG
jgi:predicted RNA-binding Zn-ribbon protein involved in translation (DUF1610 family)